MQKILRIITNMNMAALFLLCLTEPLSGVLAHEVLGLLLFALFGVHNWLNRGWYTTLLHRPYTGRRLLLLLVNLLLLADMVGLAVSGVMLSREVFAFWGLSGSWAARQWHACLAWWGLVLVAIHAGLHLSALAAPLGRSVSRRGRFFWRILGIGVIGVGVWQFIALHLGQQLAFRAFFLQVPENTSLSGLLLRLGSVAVGVALLTHYVSNLKQLFRKEKPC